MSNPKVKIDDLVTYFYAKKYEDTKASILKSLRSVLTIEQLEFCEDFYESIQTTLTLEVEDIRQLAKTGGWLTQMFLYRELMVMEEYETVEKLKEVLNVTPENSKRMASLIKKLLKAENIQDL